MSTTYAFQTLRHSWAWVFAGAVLVAGILIAVTAGVSALVLPDRLEVGVLSPILCPAEADFVVSTFTASAVTERGIGIHFACVGDSGPVREFSEVLVAFGCIGGLTVFFFVLFGLGLFVSTRRNYEAVMADSPVEE